MDMDMDMDMEPDGHGTWTWNMDMDMEHGHGHGHGHGGAASMPWSTPIPPYPCTMGLQLGCNVRNSCRARTHLIDDGGCLACRHEAVASEEHLGGHLPAGGKARRAQGAKLKVRSSRCAPPVLSSAAGRSRARALGGPVSSPDGVRAAEAALRGASSP